MRSIAEGSAIAASAGCIPSRSGSQYAVTDAMPDASEAVPAIVGGVVLVGLIWSGAVDF